MGNTLYLSQPSVSDKERAEQNRKEKKKKKMMERKMATGVTKRDQSML